MASLESVLLPSDSSLLALTSERSVDLLSKLPDLFKFLEFLESSFLSAL